MGFSRYTYQCVYEKQIELLQTKNSVQLLLNAIFILFFMD